MLEMKQDVNGTNGVETLERESKVRRCTVSPSEGSGRYNR